MRWIKASERLSQHMVKVCCRRAGQPEGWFTGAYDFSRKVYMCVHHGPHGVVPEKIDWLDEEAVETPAPSIEGGWVSVDEALPENEKPVLGFNGKIQMIVVYARVKQVSVMDIDGDNDDLDADPDKGEVYLKPGWYEMEEQFAHTYDELYMSRDITHWRSLPISPDKLK